MLNEGILEDIDKLFFIPKSSLKDESQSVEAFEEEVRSSCLILED